MSIGSFDRIHPRIAVEVDAPTAPDLERGRPEEELALVFVGDSKSSRNPKFHLDSNLDSICYAFCPLVFLAFPILETHFLGQLPSPGSCRII